MLFFLFVGGGEQVKPLRLKCHLGFDDLWEVFGFSGGFLMRCELIVI